MLKRVAIAALVAIGTLVPTIPATASPLVVPTCSDVFASEYVGGTVSSTGNFSVKITYLGLSRWLSSSGTQTVYYQNGTHSNTFNASPSGGSFTLNPKTSQAGKAEDDVLNFRGDLVCRGFFTIEYLIEGLHANTTDGHQRR